MYNQSVICVWGGGHPYGDHWCLWLLIQEVEIAQGTLNILWRNPSIPWNPSWELKQLNRESGNTLIGCGRWGEGSCQPRSKYRIPGLPIEWKYVEISVMGGMHLFLRWLQHELLVVIALCMSLVCVIIAWSYYRSDLYNE